MNRRNTQRTTKKIAALAKGMLALGYNRPQIAEKLSIGVGAVTHIKYNAWPVAAMVEPATREQVEAYLEEQHNESI